MSTSELKVWIGPTVSGELIEAVRRAGATIVEAAEASVIVWSADEEGVETLRPLLHPGIRLVQLDSAGIDHWIDTGVIDGTRAWAAAQGAYALVLAEHALTLLLAAAKGLPQAARERTWQRRRTRRLSGSTIGLIGAGAIGGRLATLLGPFEVELLAVNRSGRPLHGAAETVTVDRIADVITRADHLVLAAPLTPATTHLVGARELDLLGPDGWLVNVGRGGVVDTDALVAALAEGRIGGACLDVTDPEPLPDGHPLWCLPNTLVTPHVANWWGDHFADLAVRVEENLRRFQAGLPLLGSIDVERGY